jgi:hypothetical protein
MRCWRQLVEQASVLADEFASAFVRVSPSMSGLAYACSLESRCHHVRHAWMASSCLATNQSGSYGTATSAWVASSAEALSRSPRADVGSANSLTQAPSV